MREKHLGAEVAQLSGSLDEKNRTIDALKEELDAIKSNLDDATRFKVLSPLPKNQETNAY